MTPLHKTLTPERWAQLSPAEQMANIGAEVGRAINWRAKGREDYAVGAADRAVELLDLTLAVTKSLPRLKEIARTREAWADYFYFDNVYNSTASQWERYFYPFNFLARKNR